jgi:cell wall-associated NlpC family hydrolase
MEPLLTSSLGAGGSARRTVRWAAAALTCLALSGLWLSASAGAAGNDDSGAESSAFGALGKTMLTAIASTTHADKALDALGNGLALIEARKRVEAESAAAATTAPEAKTPPAPAVPTDPAKMPPASAGSNGTAVQRHSAVAGEKIFAHQRAGGDGSTSILLTGIALPPPDAPQAVKDVINNANMIVGRPYIWGGGHGSFYSYGYDCSGSVSFALFGGGLIPEPLTSGALEGWGAPGPGKWITVYANAGHTFAEIAGLRWDTVGDEQGTGPRWHLAPASGAGFVVRHPPGY